MFNTSRGDVAVLADNDIFFIEVIKEAGSSDWSIRKIETEIKLDKRLS